MLTELSRVIDSVVKDKGVDKDEIIKAVEDSVLSAAEKLFRMDDKYNELEVHYNEDEGEVELFEFKEVVEDGVNGYLVAPGDPGPFASALARRRTG